MNPVLRLDHRYHDVEDHDRGLVYDLATLDRRRMLKLLGLGGISAGLFTIVGCNPSGSSATPGATATATAGASQGTGATGSADAASCEVIPEETAGPFPGDGSNGPDVLSQTGVVRKDIRSSFGSSSGVAAGVPLSISLALEDGADCAPLAGAAVYVWHCDQAGNYSLYSQAAANENYLRGVQAAGDDGVVTFDSIFPACYQGRWPHIHFEVYPSLETANDEANKIATSQIALPKDVCDTVYATSGYEQSVQNLSRLSLQSDMVFARRRRRPSARDDERRRGRRLRGPPDGAGERLTAQRRPALPFRRTSSNTGPRASRRGPWPRRARPVGARRHPGGGPRREAATSRDRPRRGPRCRASGPASGRSGAQVAPLGPASSAKRARPPGASGSTTSITTRPSRS